jgi:hypothetical protein
VLNDCNKWNQSKCNNCLLIKRHFSCWVILAKHKFIFTGNGRKTKQILIRICVLGKGLLTEPCSVLLVILPSIFYALSPNKIVMMLSIMHYYVETGHFRRYSQTVIVVLSGLTSSFQGMIFQLKPVICVDICISNWLRKVCTHDGCDLYLCSSTSQILLPLRSCMYRKKCYR